MGKAVSLEARKEGKSWRTVPQCPFPLGAMLHVMEFREAEASVMEVGISLVALVVKNPSANAEDERDTSSIPGSGRSSGGGHGNPLQDSCLENPMDRGSCRAMVHTVTKSQTQLK